MNFKNELEPINHKPELRFMPPFKAALDKTGFGRIYLESNPATWTDKYRPQSPVTIPVVRASGEIEQTDAKEVDRLIERDARLLGWMIALGCVVMFGLGALLAITIASIHWEYLK